MNGDGGTESKNAPVRPTILDAKYAPLRVAFLVILAFVLTDVLLGLRIESGFSRETFRLPTDSIALLDEYLDFLADSKENNLYFIGDSTIQGQKIAPDETLPAQSALLGSSDPARFFTANLGMTAAKLPDSFYLTGKLRTHAGDVAVYNVNYKNFGAYDIAIPLRFTRLYDPALDRLTGGETKEILNLAPQDTQSKSAGAAVDDFLSRYWRLYRNRDLVNASLFGLHPRKLIKSYYQVAVAGGPAATLDRLLRKKAGAKKTWTDTRWDPWAVEILKKYYDAETLDEDNPVFHFLRPTAALAREKGMTPVFFANPMNRDLVEKFELLNRPLYEANLERVRRAVEAGGGYFFDYSDLVPSGEFIDNDHLTAAGVRRLAQRLAEDMKTLPPAPRRDEP